MDGNLLKNNVYRFFLAIVLFFCACAETSFADNLKSGAWQELNRSTGAINGTIPQADGATASVYQGSILLTPGATHVVRYDAQPRDFSVDDAANAMQVVNPYDTEGDTFAVPPLRWGNPRPPAVGLVWADAATPDRPLDPQPVLNQTFCAQNLAGRHLVVWPEIESDDASPAPTLLFQTSTGVPNQNTLPLLPQKIAIDIAPSLGHPVIVSADRRDESLDASKAKAGETITLTIVTQSCNGENIGNAPFVIRRDDAINRQKKVNNAHPVHVGDTELTTTTTLYHGTTDANGNATVVVVQPEGPGVKTHLIISSQNYPDLIAETDVIFTTLTSPDSPNAAMYGHMPESVTAELNGTTYTFTRPKLAAETSGTSGSFPENNEAWARFNWGGADSHCDILPDAEQLVAMRNAHDTLATYPGWPLSDYWSSSRDRLSEVHYSLSTQSGEVALTPDSNALLVSCVDKAQPPAHPEISLSPNGPYVAEVGEPIDLIMTVVDRDSKKPLPYRYVELLLDPSTNRQGVHKDEWDNQRVVIYSEGMRASSPEHYTGFTDANGQAHLTFKHDSGAGVETPIRIVMDDDDGGKVTLPFSMIFTVITSPDVNQANMWGHMEGIVDAGNLYKRPLLAAEASAPHGQQSENNETWATFDSVENATRQCGTGQVPDTGSLVHLYGEHPTNEMRTEHGWPTDDLAYMSSDNSQMAWVNLKDGDKGTGGSPHYLTCSANEMLAMLDVWFNDDIQSRSAAAQVGQPIKMHIHSRNALNGASIPNVDFTVTMEPGRRRDGLATGFTDPSNGEMLFDGVAYSKAQPIYQGMTDTNGDAVITLTQPRGVGLLTLLNVMPVDSVIKRAAARSVKFTVATSPDTKDANMWGHMADTITVGGTTFERPKLESEVSAGRTQNEANETWARVLHDAAEGNPEAGGCAPNRLPRIDQLQALYEANSGGAMNRVQGWPVERPYWSSSLASKTTWKSLALDSDAQSTGSTDSYYTSCLSEDNPAAAAITIEPVDPSQWYDGSGVHAVKVKKGDTMQLKVTVKDASGSPLPSAPFVLSRGDGYTREGDKHIAGSGDGIVSSVVIDGEALNDKATTIGKMTGADGSVIINVTRPDTQGTLVALTAALYGNESVNASIDAIFTVITSPDSDKAHMWGHMSASLTAADGTVYQRPLLYAELGSTGNVASYTEDNELWAGFYGPNGTKSNPANCASGYYPSAEGLDSLYRKYPNRTIKTEQGWPINRSYWSGTPSQYFGPTAIGTYDTVDLDDDGHRGWPVDGVNNMQYQICTTVPKPLAAYILLNSAIEKNSVAQAIKVKDRETIPILVTTRDAAGNPIGNTPFILTRDEGTARNSSYTGWKSQGSVLFLNGDLAQQWRPSDAFYGVTRADGTLPVDVSADSVDHTLHGVGVKNILTARLYEMPSVTSALPVIFTVVSSPDSNKANMWGHMPETFTASNGGSFKRPLLYSELSTTTDTSIYTETNEDWYLVKNVNQGRGACPMAQMATASDSQTLYGDHPGGALATDLGLPLGKNWWIGDRKLNGQYIYWQYINFKTGKTGTTTSMSNSALQLCETEPRQMNIAFSLLPRDENRGAAAVKKGESIAATVRVTNSAGQPIDSALVKINRDAGLRRDGTAYSSSGSEDDITLNAIQPSDIATFVMNVPGNFLYLKTDKQGQATFTVSQNATVGLKTTLSATLMDDETRTASQDAIFTVLTSPDSGKATMWGHMPETVTNSAGVTFHRPLLYSEMSGGTSGSYKSSNETWPLVSKTSTQMTGATGCDDAYQPLLNDLQTLYNDHPDGAIETLYGWPVTQGKYWWALDRVAITGNYQIMRLDNGVKTNTGSAGTTGAQVCLVDPHAPLPATIELTSSLPATANDEVKVKKGEEIPLTVMLKDSRGRPVANAAFTLTRGDGINRAGQVKTNGNGGATDDFTLQELTPTAANITLDRHSTFSGMTGSDGKATFSLRQDAAMGLKTAITAQMADYPNLTSTLNVIFTVVTSPDTDKAQYWGHMPETVTGSDGVVFKRPLLATEVSNEDNTFGSSHFGDEIWPLFSHSGAGLASKSTCADDRQPTLSELQTLYNTYPSGKIGELFGWPIDRPTFSWWGAGTSGAYYEVIDLTSGNVDTSKTSRDVQALVCLAEPRQAHRLK